MIFKIKVPNHEIGLAKLRQNVNSWLFWSFVDMDSGERLMNVDLMSNIMLGSIQK